MNGGLNLFIEDREAYFDPRFFMGCARAGRIDSLPVTEPGAALRQVKSEDSKLPGASVEVIQR